MMHAALPVLVVDDHAPMRRLAHELLADTGFSQISEAADGEEALALLKKERFGLVVSDWNMRPMDGLELVRRIRADEELKALPFVMVSSESRPYQISLAQRSGIDAYIIKPLNEESLRDALAKLPGVFFAR